MNHEVFKFPRDKMLCNYRIENENDDYIVLRDLGPHDQYQTITNAAEWVVAQLLNRLKGRALYYIDTDDCIDQILVHDGRFAGFAHGGPMASKPDNVIYRQLWNGDQLRGCISPAFHSLDGPDKVYFGVTVSPLRAEYLARCLDEPLCAGCGREEAECSADPCADVLADRAELDAEIPPREQLLNTLTWLTCSQCGETFPEGEGFADDLCIPCGDELYPPNLGAGIPPRIIVRCRYCRRPAAECEADPCAQAELQYEMDATAGRCSHWDEIEGWPVEDWKIEVANDDTRLGYNEWALTQKIIHAEGGEDDVTES